MLDELSQFFDEFLGLIGEGSKPGLMTEVVSFIDILTMALVSFPSD